MFVCGGGQIFQFPRISSPPPLSSSTSTTAYPPPPLYAHLHFLYEVLTATAELIIKEEGYSLLRLKGSDNNRSISIREGESDLKDGASALSLLSRVCLHLKPEILSLSLSLSLSPSSFSFPPASDQMAITLNLGRLNAAGIDVYSERERGYYANEIDI